MTVETRMRRPPKLSAETMKARRGPSLPELLGGEDEEPEVDAEPKRDRSEWLRGARGLARHTVGLRQVDWSRLEGTRRVGA